MPRKTRTKKSTKLSSGDKTVIRVLQTRIKDRRQGILNVKKRMKNEKSQSLHAIAQMKRDIADAKKKIAKIKSKK